MKRKIQEDQWARNLRDWEKTEVTESWDRVPANMWTHIAEDLPEEKPKRIIAWWQNGMLILAATIIGVAIFLNYQNILNSPNETAVAIVASDNTSDKKERAAAIFVEKEKINTSLNQLKGVASTSEDGSIQKEKAASSIDVVEKSDIEPKVIPQRLDEKTDVNEQGNSDIGNISYQEGTEIEKETIKQGELKVGERDKESEIVQGVDLKIDLDPMELITPKSQKTPAIQDIHQENDQYAVDANSQILNQDTWITTKVPILGFAIDSPNSDKKPEFLVSALASSPWSVDVYTQKKLSGVRHINTPSINTATVQSNSYGLQVNRRLVKRFSAHLGVQRSVDVIKGISRFVRVFDPEIETLSGTNRVSEFNLTTQIGGNDLLDDNVKIERDETTSIENQARLVFELERQFSMEVYSVPFQMSYNLWTEYPFQLKGFVGANFSSVKKEIRHVGVSIANPEFRISEFNRGLPSSLIRTERATDLSLQAGLRLDVYLTQNVKVLAQIDLQQQSVKLQNQLVNSGGSSVRLGLSYDF